MRVAIAAAVVVVLVASLSGCAVVPRAEKMTAAPSSAALRSIPVELRQNITYLGDDLAFDQALKASLREADLLRESAQRARFRLRAGLVNLEQPSIAVDMTVTASIHYVLEEQSTNKPIFDKTITTSFTEPFSGDPLIGFERKKRAGEGAFRANATQLIEELSRLDPPRFPAAPGPVAASPTSTDVSQAAPTTAGTVTPNQNVPDANVLPQTNRGQAGAAALVTRIATARYDVARSAARSLLSVWP